VFELPCVLAVLVRPVFSLSRLRDAIATPPCVWCPKWKPQDARQWRNGAYGGCSHEVCGYHDARQLVSLTTPHTLHVAVAHPRPCTRFLPDKRMTVPTPYPPTARLRWKTIATSRAGGSRWVASARNKHAARTEPTAEDRLER